MRYGGFTDPFEAQVAIYKELQKQTALLEQIAAVVRPQEDVKPKGKKEGGARATTGSSRGNHRKTTA